MTVIPSMPTERHLIQKTMSAAVGIEASGVLRNRSLLCNRTVLTTKPDIVLLDVKYRKTWIINITHTVDYSIHSGEKEKVLNCNSYLNIRKC